MNDGAAILHADLDAFYASVEQLLDPSLRGKPIAVGGGVVLAASYEAKAFGVYGGMPGRAARRLCPGLTFVPGHFSEYQPIADRVFDICLDFTPAIERVSIDEAFLDVSGSTHLFGPPGQIATEIRDRVRAEVGLAISIGVAGTKHLAKIASQVAKPDGLVVVEIGREAEFLAPLPVGLIWGVGPVTRERLEASGITTIGDLAAASPERLQGMLGQAIGTKLGDLSRNVDPRSVAGGRRARSVSAQSALGRQDIDEAGITATVLHLADRVSGRLRGKAIAGRTITARVRFPDMRAVTRSATLPRPVSSTAVIADVARDLVASALADNPGERAISLLAVGVSGLVEEPAKQLELGFDAPVGPGMSDEAREAARRSLEQGIDEVRRRFGRKAIDYASTGLDRRSVPDEFRGLAEREL